MTGGHRMNEDIEKVVSHCTQEAAEELNDLKGHTDDDMMLLAFHWNQMWEDSSIGFESYGFSVITPALTVVVADLNSQKCVVFHGGRRAYQTDWSESIIDGIANKSLPGKRAFESSQLA